MMFANGFHINDTHEVMMISIWTTTAQATKDIVHDDTVFSRWNIEFRSFFTFGVPILWDQPKSLTCMVDSETGLI
jgi:hypothetical protein